MKSVFLLSVYFFKSSSIFANKEKEAISMLFNPSVLACEILELLVRGHILDLVYLASTLPEDQGRSASSAHQIT